MILKIGKQKNFCILKRIGCIYIELFYLQLITVYYQDQIFEINLTIIFHMRPRKDEYHVALHNNISQKIFLGVYGTRFLLNDQQFTFVLLMNYLSI